MALVHLVYLKLETRGNAWWNGYGVPAWLDHLYGVGILGVEGGRE